MRRRLRQLEQLEHRYLLAGSPFITEFMADNDSTLLDADGVASDWIEIQNVGDEPLELAGYHLTDDQDDLDQWTFPSKVLEVGERLVVFASGNDAPDSAGNLHTNFRLSASGEYLALVSTDGTTILQDFGDAYPAQRTDISYGPQQQQSREVILGASTPAKILVPDFFSPDLGTDWTGDPTKEPYDDATWLSSTAAVGYDFLAQGPPANVAPTGIASQSSTAFDSPASLAIDGIKSNFTHTDNLANSTWQLQLPEPATLDRIVLWNRVDCCAERLSNFRVTVLGASGATVYSQDFYTPSQGGGSVVAGGSLEIELPAGTIGDLIQVQLLGQNNEENGWLSLAEVEVFEVDGFRAFFTSDLSNQLHNKSATAWMRVPFDGVELEAGETLELNVRYDDGFVAYLNGVEVARRNAPDVLSKFSTATKNRSRDDAFALETINLSAFSAGLRRDSNLLAIHALNDSVVSSDFLFSPELAIVSSTRGTDVYFTEPTPGEVNGAGVLGFTEHPEVNVTRGIYEAAFSLDLASPTLGATLVYTIDGSVPSATHGLRVPAPGPNQPPTVNMTIDHTTTLRAATIKEGYEPSRVQTFTYVLLDDVLTQPARVEGFPTVWDGISQAPIPADYEMDPQIVNDPVYGAEIRDGLTSIPSLSIVTDNDLLFGDRGVYTNSGQRGRNWEHPTSIEILETDGTQFQVDAGIRIHGYSWRYHSNTPKHSFRLEFRDEYGPSKLEYPMFRDAPVERFDSIVLRAQGGRAWAGRQNPQEAQYIRDVFARDTARDMGKIDGHAQYYHLYLNGLYWGLYHAVERPDAQMGEEYFGGDNEDYDALNRRTTTNEAIDGDLRRYNDMIALANRGIQTAEDYAEMQRYVDLDNLIDFFLIHQYMTNRDGPETFDSNNQRAIGSRVGDPNFRFFVWDMEYSMWNVNDNINIDVDVPTSASRVYTALREYPEFRLRYADRVHKHMFNDGALTPEQAAARWQTRADEIYTAIIGESARWGDAIRTQPYTRDVEWARELNRLMTTYFPNRTRILLEQLRDADLYPRLDAPEYSQHGGNVPDGYLLQMDAPSGTIYYTTDGADPRLVSSTVATPKTLVEFGATWKYLDDGSDLPEDWRGLAFDDSAWQSGPAELGYGDDDEATVVNCGPEAPACRANNFITTYFRHEFEIDDLSDVGELAFNFKRDDGAVIYLNGQEIARSNMPTGRITSETRASGAGNEREILRELVSGDALRTGTNVIAVEVHQSSPLSPDVSFDLELISTGRDGGAVSPSAIEYQGPVTLNEGTVIKSRTFQNGTWSALNEAIFYVGDPATAESLRLTEIHYHPGDDSDVEFVELQNVGQTTVSLAGLRFTDAFEFDFAQSSVASLPAGGRLVIVQDLEAFQTTYQTGAMRIAGAFQSGRLANGGEQITLVDANGTALWQVEYGDDTPWPTAPDGDGPSLEVIDPLGPLQDPANWKASTIRGGTPGTGELMPGDSNRDGIFSSSDLVLIFQINEYEDQLVANSTWDEGDWNGDQEFTTQDLVYAFQSSTYSAAAMIGPFATPPAARISDETKLDSDACDWCWAEAAQSLLKSPLEDGSREWPLRKRAGALLA